MGTFIVNLIMAIPNINMSTRADTDPKRIPELPAEADFMLIEERKMTDSKASLNTTTKDKKASPHPVIFIHQPVYFFFYKFCPL